MLQKHLPTFGNALTFLHLGDRLTTFSNPRDRMTFGEVLKKCRKARLMSQQQLANLLGRSVNYINQLERGRKTSPSAQLLKDIVSFLNLTPPEINELLDSAGYVQRWDEVQSFFLRRTPLPAEWDATLGQMTLSPIPRLIAITMFDMLGETSTAQSPDKVNVDKFMFLNNLMDLLRSIGKAADYNEALAIVQKLRETLK